MVFQRFEYPRLASLGLAALVTHAAASLRAQLRYISCLLRPGHLIATYSLDRGARHPGTDGVPVHKKGILTLNLFGNLRYALRQFRLSPLFTATAVFTLALGIGGTTAIFSLMHAVMLSSLPVADPARLYRIGDGNDCCVEGSLQGNWGMYSFPLYERLTLETPEFEEVAAFQAAPSQFSVRREAVDR